MDTRPGSVAEQRDGMFSAWTEKTAVPPFRLLFLWPRNGYNRVSLFKKQIIPLVTAVLQFLPAARQLHADYYFLVVCLDFLTRALGFQPWDVAEHLAFVAA